MDLVILYVPCPDRETAVNLVSILLREKLIACGNVHQAESLYEWKGDMVKEDEWIAVMKTLDQCIGKAETKIISEHPYEVPGIIRWSAKCNEAYHLWLKHQLEIG